MLKKATLLNLKKQGSYPLNYLIFTQRILLSFSFLLGMVLLATPAQSEQDLHDPVAQKIIASPAFLRLQHMSLLPFGIHPDFKNPPTHYDLALGIYHLLQAKNLSKTAQYAGLLYPLHQPAFSNAMIFSASAATPFSFDDSNPQATLYTPTIDAALTAENINPNDLYHFTHSPSHHSGRLISAEAPHVSAQSLVRCLLVAEYMKILTKEQKAEILEDLSWEEDQWVFSTLKPAKTLAMSSLTLENKLYLTAETQAHMQHLLAHLNSLLEKEHLSLQDLRTYTEYEILNMHDLHKKLSQSPSNFPQIFAHLNTISEQPFQNNFKSSYFFLEPLIKGTHTIEPLHVTDMEVEQAFAQHYQKIESNIHKT